MFAQYLLRLDWDNLGEMVKIWKSQGRLDFCLTNYSYIIDVFLFPTSIRTTLPVRYLNICLLFICLPRKKAYNSKFYWNNKLQTNILKFLFLFDHKTWKKEQTINWRKYGTCKWCVYKILCTFSKRRFNLKYEWHVQTVSSTTNSPQISYLTTKVS